MAVPQSSSHVGLVAKPSCPKQGVRSYKDFCDNPFCGSKVDSERRRVQFLSYDGVLACCFPDVSVLLPIQWRYELTHRRASYHLFHCHPKRYSLSWRKVWKCLNNLAALWRPLHCEGRWFCPGDEMLLQGSWEQPRFVRFLHLLLRRSQAGGRGGCPAVDLCRMKLIKHKHLSLHMVSLYSSPNRDLTVTSVHLGQ